MTKLERLVSRIIDEYEDIENDPEIIWSHSTNGTYEKLELFERFIEKARHLLDEED